MTEQNYLAENEATGADEIKNLPTTVPLCMARKTPRQSTAGLTSNEIPAPTGTHQFDAPIILKKLRERSTKKRHQCYLKSSLMRYRAEIVALREAGASYREIKIWLGAEKHLKFQHTTLMRFIKKLPELQPKSKQEETSHA